jgi:hypothetical protein
VTRALAATTLLIGLAVAGCGSDDSGETTAPTPSVSIPAVTSPIPATTTAPVTTSTRTGTTGKGNGGSGPPKSTNPNLPDSATNDVAPPAGSPQEAFEKQCEQNPKACG